MDIFELYLADVKWSEKNKVAQFLPSKFTVPICRGADESVYEATIPAYYREGRHCFQLAIKSTYPCYIKIGEDMVELFPVTDDGEQWWIEKGSWDKDYNSHDALSFRTPGGTLHLVVAGINVIVYIANPGFDEADFEFMLEDFQLWCWQMIVDEASYITVGQMKEVKVLSPQFLAIIDIFLKNVEAILALPNSELRESIKLQKIERLRPNMGSIRHIAQRGETPMIPGRSTTPHHNTIENRFVHGMVKIIEKIIRPQKIFAESSFTKYLHTADSYAEKAKTLKEQIYEPVDRDIFDNNLSKTQKKRDETQNLLSSGSKLIEISKDNAEALDYKKKYVGRYGNRWALVYVHFSLTEEIDKYLLKYNKIMLIGEILLEDCVGKNDKPYYKARINNQTIKYIGPARDYGMECKQLESKRKELEKNGWARKLPPDILEARRNEAIHLEKRSATIRNTIEENENLVHEIQTKLVQLSIFRKKCCELKIVPETVFVSSMVFLQSPVYSGALTAFRRLRSMAGIDDKLFESLLSLEDVGIRDWASLFERWCLISILQVLKDDFKFEFMQQEINQLLKKHFLKRKSGSIEVKAKRPDMDLSMSLKTQPYLKNGRNPDYSLTITNEKSDTNTMQNKSVTLIIDAKSCAFKPRDENAKFDKFQYLDDALYDLIKTKNYSEDGKNSVFILHPSKNRCVTNPTTHQQWATSSSLGGDSVFNWEGLESPDHSFGAVLVRPYDLTNLKRLILLMIQYDLGRMDICPSCGAGGALMETVQGRGVGVHWRCQKCQFLSVSSHCFSCWHDLVKNGVIWTYHDLHPTEVWNVKCPACGALLSSQKTQE